MTTILNTERVQRMRSAIGLTQADLATTLDVPVSTVARFESGRLDCDDATVVSIAQRLDCSPNMLTRPAPDILYTRPWLRAYADAPKKTVDQYMADTLVAVEAFGALKLRLMPDRLPTFDGDANDEHDIDDFALSVRHAADVSADSGVPNVTRAAERLGCVVLPMESELGKHLGMSTRADDIPIIRVSRANESVPGDRQRFTVAHELGHLLLHSTCPPPESSEQAKIIEKQAHRFAASFLMPGDPFLVDLSEVNGGRVTLSTLVTLKERWGASIKSMVVRLQQLGRIDSDQARSLYKQISSRGWNTGEPVFVGNERAVWLSKALSRRLPNDQTLSDIGDQSELHSTWFDRWTAWEPPSTPDANILQFARRGSRVPPLQSATPLGS